MKEPVKKSLLLYATKYFPPYNSEAKKPDNWMYNTICSMIPDTFCPMEMRCNVAGLYEMGDVVNFIDQNTDHPVMVNLNWLVKLLEFIKDIDEDYLFGFREELEKLITTLEKEEARGSLWSISYDVIDYGD